MADQRRPNYYSAEEATMLFLGDYVDDSENFFWKCTFVSAIISQLFRVIMFAKYALTILELNWNKRFRDNKTKLNVICHHLLTSSTQQLQNRSFHVAERTRMCAKCQNVKNARAKRAKLLFFIVKYANLRRFCCRLRHSCLRDWGPFLESPETLRAHFGWHISISIFKAKASRGTKLCRYFIFYSLYNKWKDQPYRISWAQF